MTYLILNWLFLFLSRYIQRPPGFGIRSHDLKFFTLLDKGLKSLFLQLIIALARAPPYQWHAETSICHSIQTHIGRFHNQPRPNPFAYTLRSTPLFAYKK